MKRITTTIVTMCVLLLCIGSSVALRAQNVSPAPAQLAAVLTPKLVAFEKSLAEKQGLTIYVMNAPDVARELRKAIGITLPDTKVKVISVEEGSTLPSTKPDVIFIGSLEGAHKIIRYARQNSILTVCNDNDILSVGATLMIGVANTEGKEKGRPRLILNSTASQSEGKEWNPAIYKYAQVVK